MIRAAYHSASFRDPSGRVYCENECFFRVVNSTSVEFTLDILKKLEKEPSSFWVKSLVATELYENNSTGSVILKHEKINDVTYPYEWSPEQLRAAAVFTLDLQLDLLRNNLSLKDATPFNIVFRKGRPVFVDFNSIEKYQDKQPWAAWNDFQEHFTYVLLVYAYTGFYMAPVLGSRLSRCNVSTAAQIIGTRSLFSWSLLKYLRIPNWVFLSERKKSEGRGNRGPTLKKELLIANLEDLKTTLSSLSFSNFASHWETYQICCHYSVHDQNAKKNFVEEVAKQTSEPESHALDIGSNTGEYSLVLSEYFRNVIAIESDVEASSRIFTKASNGNLAIVPVLANFSSLTPAHGWGGIERSSFCDRFKGSKLTLALAVIHHLRISDGIPLSLILEEFKKYSENLIIEWVALDDPMSKRLLNGRDASLFEDYNLENFNKLISEIAFIKKELKLSNQRILYWVEFKSK